MFRLTVCLALTLSTLAAAEETRSFVVADSSMSRIAVIGEDGATQWEAKIGPLHDLHALPSGHILYQSDLRTLVEADRATGETVWTFDAAKAVPEGYDGAYEVHAFQRLDSRRTAMAVSGPSLFATVDERGDVLSRRPMRVSRSNAHRDSRLVRWLDNGHVLACHEADGVVREYDGDGEVVWEYEVPLVDYPSGEPRERAGGHGPEAFGNQAFSAVRLPSGNTLIGTGNGHAVIEVTPEKDVVWSVGQRELPGVVLAWVTTVEVLPSRNIMIGNCHAGPDQPQLVEVSRDKRVVWTFEDHDRFGDATTNSQVLTVNGESVVGRTVR